MIFLGIYSPVGRLVGFLTTPPDYPEDGDWYIGLMVLDVSRSGIDIEAFKARFYPTQTIETSKETLEWLKSKTPPGTGS